MNQTGSLYTILVTRARIGKLAILPERHAAFVEPMECLPVSKLPEGSQWLWEIKLDGYRALGVRNESGATLFSRRRISLNRKFPSIIEALSKLPEGTVVDGELVALDDHGRPEFNLLQNFRCAESRIHYYIFDLLCCEGRDLTQLPFVERPNAANKPLALADARTLGNPTTLNDRAETARFVGS